MNLSEYKQLPIDIASKAQIMRADGDQFAIATVVRTLSVTAAKPGAKAIINANGEIVSGWIGGGCAKSAVVKAARQSIQDAEPKLVSLQPEEFLKEQGLTAGVENNGVLAARNMCPSQGSMDIFIEPFLAEPELLILGASPVAIMVASLAAHFAFNVSCACAEPSLWEGSNIEAAALEAVPLKHEHRYIVVATQGSGDSHALETALTLQSKWVSFVGSQRKTEHLKNKLRASEFSSDQVDSIKGPAGLDIGAISPQEIALSILAELVAVRRSKSAPNV